MIAYNVYKVYFYWEMGDNMYVGRVNDSFSFSYFTNFKQK